MDLGAPVRSEAVGDLAEHDRGADLALRDVVGGGDLTVGEKDEEFAPPCFDLFEQHFSSWMRDGHPHQAGQHIVSLGGVGGERCVFQAASSLADPDGPAQMIADFWGEGHVAAIDGVLNITQHMGEADLMFAAQFLLSGIAVRDPDIGLMARQYIFGDLARPAPGNLVQDGLVREKHPLPMRDTVGARGRLVRGDDPRRQQLVGDCLGRCRHASAHAAKSVGNSALGNDEAEQLLGDPRQALESDMMAVVQIGQKRANAGTEWRARCHPGRRLGSKAFATFPAAAAEQFDTGHNRADRRQVDMIIAMAATLGLARNIGSAVATGRGHDLLSLIRRLGQRAVRAFARWAPTALGLATHAAALPEIVLRGRNMRVLRGLARLADQGFQFRNPGRQALNHLVLRKEQLVLLGFGQDMKRGWRHRQFESNLDSPRKSFLPTP